MSDNLDLSIFDIVGPVMLGPSSSGTAGMMRIGAAARQFLTAGPVKIVICFHERNMGHYEGCCSHIALVGGLLGFSADDPRLPGALSEAERRGIPVEIRSYPAEESPDMLRVKLYTETSDGLCREFVATSVGGGNIRVEKIDGCPVDLNNYAAYRFTYRGEKIVGYEKLADLAGTFGNAPEHPATVMDDRRDGSDRVLDAAPFFEGEMTGNAPLFTEFSELIALCEKENCDPAEIMIRYEVTRSGKSREEIVSRMQDMWRIIKRSVSEGSRGTYRPIMGLDDGKNGLRVLEAIRKGQAVSGSVSAKAAAYALSVMEYAVSMGCIVAAPTCGSAGVVPGALAALQEEYGFSDEQMVNALFVMTSIGIVMAYDGVRFSGCAAGCQGEMTVSAAMAAMGAAYLGTIRLCADHRNTSHPDAVCPEAVFPNAACPDAEIFCPREMTGAMICRIAGNAAAFAVKGLLGLVCDPVAGVEVPCIKRNVSAVMAALGSADMAIAGVESFLTPDQASAALKDVQDHLPEYLRGGGGGCASCFRA